MSTFTVGIAQQKTIAGINVTGERTSSDDFVTGIGATMERKLGNHHGFETGAYYRTFLLHYYIYVNGLEYGKSNVREKYLSIPVLYKYYSSIINVSAGPTFDVYLGWGEKASSSTTYRHTVKSNFQVGIIGKVSKSIPLTPKILLEPEIRYNPVFYEKRSYYGAAISVKYVF